MSQSPPRSLNEEVVIQIVNFNQAELLPHCLTAVQGQGYHACTVIVADNGSTDHSVEVLKRDFSEIHLQVSKDNRGYGAAHNTLLQGHQAPFVLMLNVDVRLSPTYVGDLVRFLQQHPTAGMVQGRLLQWREEGATNRVDNFGVRLHRDRRNDLLGYGEENRNHYSEPFEIFGCDGAAVLYRRSMFEDIVYEGQYFDEAFFLFREDVDVAWRARWRGWRAWCLPSAIAWHIRRYKPGSRRRQARWLRRLQLRNRYFLLVKHESWHNLGKDFWPWVWFELRAIAYTTLIEPHYWLSYGGVISHLAHLWRQRRHIAMRRRVSAETIRFWLDKTPHVQ